MNERIQELAEQAWTMVSDEERARNQLYEADTQRERRDQVFAELIVQECAEVLDTWNKENGAEEGLPKEGLISLWSSHFGVDSLDN